MIPLVLAALIPFGQFLHQPAPAAVIPYRTTAEGALRLYEFAGHGTGTRPAVMWIHGGGWTGGTCESFFPLARYTAARGATSFVVEYQLVKPGAVSLADAISDCQAAVRYVRTHAAELHVDPKRIAVIGESAGGHLAACVDLLEAMRGVSRQASRGAADEGVSARPDALVLYNPLVDFTGSPFARLLPVPSAAGALDRTNAIRAFSPIFHVRSGLPPTLVVHGLADTVIDPAASRRFAAAMQAAGNRCDLVLLPDTPHAFLIPAYKCSEAVVVHALSLADRFLTSLGWFTGAPTLTVSDPPAWAPKWPPAKLR